MASCEMHRLRLDRRWPDPIVKGNLDKVSQVPDTAVMSAEQVTVLYTPDLWPKTILTSDK